MIYIDGQKVTVWETENKGNWTQVRFSTSRKDKKTGEWKNSYWSFVRFIGEAHKKAAELQQRDKIIIHGGISREEYKNNDGKRAWPKSPRIVVFNFDWPELDNNGVENNDNPPVVDDDENDELPF